MRHVVKCFSPLCFYSWSSSLFHNWFVTWFISSWLLVLQICASEESNQHSGVFVFLFGQLLSSIPFLFLISISSSLVFYFLVGLRDEFSLLMYFVLNFFMCLLVNEGLVLAVVSIWKDVFWSVLTLVSIQVSSIISMKQSYS